MMHKNNFQECLDAMFLSQAPKIPGKGEDNFCCLCQVSQTSAIVSVFDGCGGLGGRKYPGFKNHTGAYVASRLASGALHDWYEKTHDTDWKSSRELCESLNRYLMKNLSLGPVYGKNNQRLRGAMVRDFPATAAIALARWENGKVVLHIIWAGDSRVYLLDEQGLAQITADDSENQDALDNLTNDGELTNLLSSDGNYTLHYKRLVLNGPAMVFAATDGCFGYIPSPMEFEYTVVKAMAEAKSINDLKSRLTAEFRSVTGDDFALCCMSFFCDSFQGMQKLALPRVQLLEQEYLPVLRADRDSVQRLWARYRGNYERYL